MWASMAGIILIIIGALLFWFCMINVIVIPMWWFAIPIILIGWGCFLILKEFI